MHTAELLDEALSLAARLGYRVRQEWLDGQGGGLCVVRGERWIFVDLSQTLSEQFECVAGAMREDEELKKEALSSGLANYLDSESNDRVVDKSVRTA